VYPLHLADEVKIDHTNVLSNHLKSFQSACECLDTGLSIGKALLPTSGSDAGSELSVLYKTTEGEVNELKQVIKSMKRRLPQQEEQFASTGGSNTVGESTASNCTVLLIAEPSVCYTSSDAQRMDLAVKDMSKLTKAFGVFCKNGMQQASLLSESGIPLQKLTNFLKNAVDSVFLEDTSTIVGNDTPLNGFEIIKSIMNTTIKTIGDQNRALQDGEWDISDIAKEKEARSSIRAPVFIRAETYKEEIKEAESMKYRLENKEDGLKEMKRSIKEKAEELSEMQIRKDKADKRLTDATRDAEMVREKLQRKLDDTQALLKRKEKEFEETMDQLQTDIDGLENERGELKNKLKETTKKVLLEGISRGNPSLASSLPGGSPVSLSGGVGGPISLGPSVSAPVRDSPMLLKQNKCLQMAILSAKEECYRRQGEELKRRLTKMKPLIVPKKLVRGIDIVPSVVSPESPACEKRDISKEETPSLDELIRKVGNLRHRIDTALVSVTVPDLSNRRNNSRVQGIDLMSTAGSARKDLVIKSLREKQLKDETEQLRLEVAGLIASRKPGGQVDADFCKFPTPQMSRALNEELKDYKVVGRITVNGNSDEVRIKTIPIIIGPKDLKQIHQRILS
jgi:dynactin 1